ncbi:hypothetical protein QQF64_034583 [Cirrhinus molitorella]|uniref:SET domain-containing protein n=1 Tax=Cirrhinus molitorella TaxID=172907 RepID=A0ABR3L103_9TELE
MASERFLSVEQCWSVLQSAENDVLKHIVNLMMDWRYIREMTREQELLLVYFLEALVMLCFLQEPEVVKKMTVSDWLQRTDIEGNGERVLVGVNECNAFFVLTKEEETWFDVYYSYLRSVMIERRHKRCSSDEAEKFFMYSSGNPVDNPSEDLKKLHDEYHSQASALICPADAPEPKWMNPNIAFCLLKMSHPVTLQATPPAKAARVQISRKFESSCLSLWCVTQRKLRERLVLDTFGPRQPSESKVHSWIERQGWMANVPDAAEVMKDWKPPQSIQAPTDSQSIRRMSRRQCWKGLQLMDREGKGLRGSPAGRLLAERNGQDMCLDAHEERCHCHPNKTTFGRQIKHSVQRANLSPRLHFVEDEPVILFMATRDIQTGEEICYDYGDNRRSYAGDGLDLTLS